MKQTTRFSRILMCMVLGLSVSYQSCKDYDDDIDDLNNRVDGVISDLSDLKTMVEGLDYVKSVTYDKNTGILTVTPAKGNAVTHSLGQDIPEYVLKTNGTSCWLEKDGKQAGEKMTVTLPAEFDAQKFSVAEVNGKWAVTYDGEPAFEIPKQQLPAEFDPKSMKLEEGWVVYGEGENKTKIFEIPVGEKFDAQLLTIKTDPEDGIEKIFYGEMATKVQLPKVEIPSITWAGNNVTIKTGEKPEETITFTVGTVISTRLASVTLVPKVFIDGIEAIEFQSLKYVPMIFDKTKGWIENTAETEKILSNGSTTALYRLNPTGVQKNDILLPSFLSNRAVAKTKATEGENTPIKADSYEIDEKTGIMTVKASKTVTTSLELEGENIWTVALKVPVAEKNLVEGEEEAFVYSEYVRLAESTVNPKIAAQPYNVLKAPHHYSDSLTIYKSAIDAKELVTKEVKMDKTTAEATLNLYDLVTGCAVKDDKHSKLTRKELESYGLEFRFAVATGAYNDIKNKTNQQKFAKIYQDTLLIPALPDGETNNFASAGKEPIVRVSLIDTKNGNKIVDVRYLKIKWVKEVMGDQDLGVINEYDETLGCNDLKLPVSWEEMHTKVYAKLGDLGLSFDEFKQIYPMEYDAEVDEIISMKYSGDGSIGGVDSDYPADSYAFVWTLTAEDMGAIYPERLKTYTVTITCTPSVSTYPKVSFELEANVSLPELPVINGFFENYWQTVGSLYRVTPVHYDPKGGEDQKCKFDNNLMNGFTYYDYSNGDKFIVKGLSECMTWDMQFSTTGQMNGYAPAYTGAQPDKDRANNIGGYNLKKGEELAAQLTWPEEHTAWCKNPEHHFANIVLQKNDAGKGLIGKTANITVWAMLNEYNYFPVHTYDVLFVVPLTINSNLEGEFQDHIYSGSRISLAKAFTMTDFANYIVAEETPDETDEHKKYAAELYKYYEVQAPKWDTQNAKISMKKVTENGKTSYKVDNDLKPENCVDLSEVYTEASVTVDKSTNELVFYNNGGSNVEEECYIYVKAIVTYGWGSAEEWVRIKVLPNLAKNNQ